MKRTCSRVLGGRPQTPAPDRAQHTDPPRVRPSEVTRAVLKGVLRDIL